MLDIYHFIAHVDTVFSAPVISIARAAAAAIARAAAAAAVEPAVVEVAVEVAAPAAAPAAPAEGPQRPVLARETNTSSSGGKTRFHG